MGWRSRLRNQIMSAAMGARFVARGAPGRGRVALTFDDGPHPEHTPAVLDVLASHGAHATFFVTGAQAEGQQALLGRMVAAGHELGNHSWNHDHFHERSTQAQFDEIARTDALLERFDGRRERWFRPPRGIITTRMTATFLLRRHPVALWSIDSLDYRATDIDAIVGRFEGIEPADGEIILFHDDVAHAAAAVDRLLARWRGLGLSFTTLSELA